MSETPLISVIMPTRNRRQFLGQAIKLFLAQDYPNKELVIVDCSDIPSGDLEEVSPAVRYIWLSTPLTVGMMRNIACSLAQGEIICHQDDDDYFGPQRLSRQVAPILAKKTNITGIFMSLMLRTSDTSLWAISEEMHGKLFGYGVRCGTLMYRSFCWRSSNCAYPNVSRGEDSAFLSQQYGDGERVERITDPSSYICVRHGSNETDSLDTTDWEQVPLEYYLSGDDLAFYMGLRSEVNV